MDVLVLIGRIMYGMLFIGSAFGHLTQTDGMAGYAESRGVPSPRLAVQVTGAQILLGGLMVLLGVWADLGALLLVLFLVLAAVLMHGPWKFDDPEERQMEMIQFMKDLALAGAGLALFAFLSNTPDLGLTITGPLFGT